MKNFDFKSDVVAILHRLIVDESERVGFGGFFSSISQEEGDIKVSLSTENSDLEIPISTLIEFLKSKPTYKFEPSGFRRELLAPIFFRELSSMPKVVSKRGRRMPHGELNFLENQAGTLYHEYPIGQDPNDTKYWILGFPQPHNRWLYASELAEHEDDYPSYFIRYSQKENALVFDDPVLLVRLAIEQIKFSLIKGEAIWGDTDFIHDLQLGFRVEPYDSDRAIRRLIARDFLLDFHQKVTSRQEKIHLWEMPKIENQWDT